MEEKQTPFTSCDLQMEHLNEQVTGRLPERNNKRAREKEKDGDLAKQPTINNRELLLRHCQCEEGGRVSQPFEDFDGTKPASL